ncbi:MAG TPA: hypothetical protein VMI53_12535 [Opitutaceae bacterium]|nr:hypothetical protein [Opitutaceae bacterium]
MHDDSSPTWLQTIAAYPPWLVITCVAVAAAALLWLAGRLLARTVELIPAAVFVIGGAAVVWWLLR